MQKPADLHDRDAEWADLVEFATDSRRGATLALIYGRRRQGKTLMLELLTAGLNGVMFAGLQQSAAQNLEAFSRAYARHRALPPAVSFADWTSAIEAVLALDTTGGWPLPVVLDEFGYLLASSPELASVIQTALSPRSVARTRSRVRLILCGSALTTMRSLLTGGAPLRGRASTEIVLHPFDFRASAEHWGLLDQPALAYRVNALLGGTPAYPEMAGTAPKNLPGLGRWVQRQLLNPSSALFREGSILLQEEPEISDPTTYHSVLSAISQGRTRRSELGAALSRPDSSLTHPLTVLEHLQLIERLDDAFRQKRSTYRIREPIIRTHQLLIRPNEARLVARAADRVWAEAQDLVSSLIYGPHFEHLARVWCLHYASSATLGGTTTSVRPAVLACPQHGQGHELDVVAIDGRPGQGERVVAIGEAKAQNSVMGLDALERLDHLRALLPASHLSGTPRVLLFSAAGFHRDLVATEVTRGDVELVDLSRLYDGS